MHPDICSPPPPGEGVVNSVAAVAGLERNNCTINVIGKSHKYCKCIRVKLINFFTPFSFLLEAVLELRQTASEKPVIYTRRLQCSALLWHGAQVRNEPTVSIESSTHQSSWFS